MVPGAAVVRGWVAPAVRRVRREVQWRRAGDLRLSRGPLDGHEHAVAEHATPLVRDLAGLDPVLQRGKAVNLGLAAARLDGLLVRSGQTLSFWKHVGAPTRRRASATGWCSTTAGCPGGWAAACARRRTSSTG